MIFNEINNVYYLTVSKIINELLKRTLTDREVIDIIKETAFSESFIQIYQSIKEEKWQLITRDMETVIKNPIKSYLTELEKRWLQSIFMDKRIKLFCDESPKVFNIKPLYHEEDFYYFDIKKNGDNYNDEKYIKNFRKLLKGISEKKKLMIKSLNRGKRITEIEVVPNKIEYSYKDDKFRFLGIKDGKEKIFNISNIIECELTGLYEDIEKEIIPVEQRKIIVDLIDARDALERAMLHFSDFKKITEKIEEKKYKMEIYYEAIDETEVLIRVLSFGPMLRVTYPKRFILLIKERLKKQKKLWTF
ncbi:hypothetical protein [Fusobacterium varium]|uniref:hypothetical protein n=1 Tax=Fusobacterium varium TaxID=856 RepID=UPI0027DD0676|nr:hypothetical protein [uncultured Fusobacterium sp.]